MFACCKFDANPIFRPVIEYGRYQNMPQEERLCKLCDSNEVEDEYHFAMSCKTYNSLRNDFLNTTNNVNSTNMDFTNRTQLSEIMGKKENETISALSKYIFSCSI